jgi:hypothetical protein
LVRIVIDWIGIGHRQRATPDKQETDPAPADREIGTAA